jgi:hypothetical protein
MEERSALDRKFDDLEARLAGRQLAIQEHLRGPSGERGQRGARGERGATGPRGPTGRPAIEAPTITAFKVDAPNYRLVPFLSNGQPAGEIDLKPMFETFLRELPSLIREGVRAALAEAQRPW